MGSLSEALSKSGLADLSPTQHKILKSLNWVTYTDIDKLCKAAQMSDGLVRHEVATLNKMFQVLDIRYHPYGVKWLPEKDMSDCQFGPKIKVGDALGASRNVPHSNRVAGRAPGPVETIYTAHPKPEQPQTAPVEAPMEQTKEHPFYALSSKLGSDAKLAKALDLPHPTIFSWRKRLVATGLIEVRKSTYDKVVAKFPEFANHPGFAAYVMSDAHKKKVSENISRQNAKVRARSAKAKPVQPTAKEELSVDDIVLTKAADVAPPNYTNAAELAKAAFRLSKEIKVTYVEAVEMIKEAV